MQGVKIRLLLTLSVIALALRAGAQDTQLTQAAPTARSAWSRPSYRVEVTPTLGTDGIGLDVAVPITAAWRVRGGFSMVPHITFPFRMELAMQNGYEEATGEAKKAMNQHTRELLATLKDFTGADVDAYVNIHLVPNYYDLKMLVDWYPFQGRKWRLTAGVYLGRKQIGYAYNYGDETTFLQTLIAYNHIYDNVLNEQPVVSVDGRWAEFDPFVNEKILSYGPADFYVGVRKDGSYYHVQPAADGTIRAKAYVNRNVRPYLGLGYDGVIGRQQRCTIGFEAGCAFWGGKPHVVVHDGTDLSYDMDRIVKLNLRDLVNAISALHVLPVIEFRLGWRL